MNNVRIDHSSIVKEFLAHLNDSENKRILFSGPFGTGKSTFLNEFFSDEKKDFFSFSIYPINYCIASNQDIFELIKYDILVEILERYSTVSNFIKEEFSTLLASQVYLLNKANFLPAITTILGMTDEIGKSAGELIKVLPESIKNFKKFKEEMETDELKFISAYLENFKKIKGSIKERDDISNLIFDLIGRIKEDKNNCQSVLIIDDLDRLDPEHIFRLFNIFSTHYNEFSENNKFGFDKIIFVCDIENIRKIFNNRYGQDVDFTGYVNKFYSKKVFEFDNRRFIREKILSLMRNIKYPSQQLENKYSLDNNKRTYFAYVFEWLICSMIDAREMNLRTLINKVNIEFFDYEIKISHYTYYASQFDLIFLFGILKNFYPSYSVLEAKINKLAEQSEAVLNTNLELNSSQNSDALINIIVSYILPFILPEEKMFKDNMRSKSSEEKQKPYYLNNFDCYIHYYFKGNGDDGNNKPYLNKFTLEEGFESQQVSINLYRLLHYIFVKCQQKGYLK